MKANVMNRTQKLQYLYLDNPEEPRLPGFSNLPARTASPDRITKKRADSCHIPPTVTRSDSKASTASSGSRYSDSRSSVARKDSLSSAATSVNSAPPWHHPTLNQQMAATPFNFGYDLPCEFFFAGCYLRFNPADFEAWISHSASHLGVSPPRKAICTFCDDDEAVFESHGDAFLTWRERMLHIGSHLANLTPYEHMRPDYGVIEHMWENGLISAEDYAYAKEHTERPYLDHAHSLDYQTPAMLNQKEKELQQRHNLDNEKRLMKKEAKREGKKGKSTDAPSSAHRRKKSYKPRIEKKEH